MLTFKRRTPEKSSRATMDRPPRKAKSRRRRNPELSDSEIFEKAKQAALDLYTELETNDRWFEDDPMPGETIQVGNQKVDYVEEKVVVQTSKGPKTQTVRRPLGWKELFAREAIMKPFVGEVLKEVYQTAGDPPEVFMGFVKEDPAVVSYKNDITINAFGPIKSLPAADFPPDRQILDLALQQAEGAYNRFIRDVRSRYPRPEDIISEEEVDEIYEDIDPEVRRKAIEQWQRREAEMRGEVYDSPEEEAEFMRMVEEEVTLSEKMRKARDAAFRKRIKDDLSEKDRKRMLARLRGEVFMEEDPEILQMTPAERMRFMQRRDEMLRETLGEVDAEEIKKYLAEMRGEVTDETAIAMAKFTNLVKQNLAKGRTPHMAILYALAPEREEGADWENVEELKQKLQMEGESLRDFADKWAAIYGTNSELFASSRELRDDWDYPEPVDNPKKKKRRRKNADDGAGQALGITVLIIAKIAEGELDIRGFTLEDLGLNPGFRSGAKHLIDEGFINEVGRTTDGEVYYSLTPSAKKQLIEDGVMFESYGQSAEPTGRRAKLTVVPDFENNPKSKGKKKAAKKTAKKATKKATTAEPKKRGRPKKATVATAAPAAPKKRGRPKKATAAPAAPAAAPKRRGRPKKNP